MIGLSNHVRSLCETKTNAIDKFNELNAKVEQLINENQTLLNEINRLKTILENIQNSYISNIEIQDLVTDIKDSFEVFMNNTPRATPSPDLENRIKNLEEKINNSAYSFEIVEKVQERKIPKLNLQKKKA